MTEVLIVSLYGFANRYREGKRPNDLLLASVIPVITEVGLPFIMYGDFNEPVHKLASFQFFKDLGAVEAFQWYQSKFGVLLPATCGGSTRNDSAIFHPDIAGWIEDMQVLPEHQIDMHSVVHSAQFGEDEYCQTHVETTEDLGTFCTIKRGHC